MSVHSSVRVSVDVSVSREGNQISFKYSLHEGTLCLLKSLESIYKKESYGTSIYCYLFLHSVEDIRLTSNKVHKY